jgi:hypothetical protein
VVGAEDGAEDGRIWGVHDSKLKLGRMQDDIIWRNYLANFLEFRTGTRIASLKTLHF